MKVGMVGSQFMMSGGCNILSCGNIAYRNTKWYNSNTKKEEICMAKTTSIFARVEPEIKEQAEIVLNKLGIPMSIAVNIFLRQVVLQNGLPFEVKITHNKPLAFEDLTPEEFNNEIEKGFNDLRAGRVVSADKVAERITREYGHEL